MKDYKKYIDVGDAVKILCNDCIRYVFPTTAEPTTEFIKLRNAINLLRLYPSADVAPIVRCKDCKYWQPSEYGVVEQPYCKHLGYKEETGLDIQIGNENDYCSVGERKDDDKSCDTCKHYDKGWDDIICDGCTKAHSNWERSRR